MMNPGDSRTIPIGAYGVQALLFGVPSNTVGDDYFSVFSIEATPGFSIDGPPPISTTTPEPGSMALLGSGLSGLGVAARRRSARK
jgi:hypothetical protein